MLNPAGQRPPCIVEALPYHGVLQCPVGPNQATRIYKWHNCGTHQTTTKNGQTHRDLPIPIHKYSQIFTNPSFWAARACVTLKRWFGFPFLEPTQLTESHHHALLAKGVAGNATLWCCKIFIVLPSFVPFQGNHQHLTPKMVCQHRIQQAERLSDLQSTVISKMVSLGFPTQFPLNLTNLHRITVSFRASLEAAEPGLVAWGGFFGQRSGPLEVGPKNARIGMNKNGIVINQIANMNIYIYIYNIILYIYIYYHSNLS